MPDSQRCFGRRFVPDARDKKFAISPPREGAQITSRTWFSRDVFDQGATSQCTAYASVGWLRAGPVRNLSKLPSFEELYRDFQRNDEWPGEEPTYEGSSIRAAMKVLKRRGYVSEYRWAWTLDPVIDHIMAVGPMVAGTTWFSGQMDADKQGFIHATGRAVGGHAYLVIGANRQKLCPDGSRGCVRILNSWGRGWADSGRAWISFVDLAKLLADDGEAATATEIIQQPATTAAAA